MPSSRELDHVRMFARSVADVALLMSVLAGADNRDPNCYGALVPNSSNHIFSMSYISINHLEGCVV